MSSANLPMHDDGVAAHKRQRMVWFATLLVVAGLLCLRAFIGTSVGKAATPTEAAKERPMHSFGLVYVEPETKGFVRLTPVELAATKDEAEKAGEKLTSAQPQWRAAKDGEAATIEWKVWKNSSPAEFVVDGIDTKGAKGIQLSWPRTLGLWLGAFFTLAVFSFLAGDNPAYKFTEAVVVGVSAAYWMVVAFWDTLVPKLIFALAPGAVKEHVTPMAADLHSPDGFQWMEALTLSPATIAFAVALIPLGLGILLLCRLNRKTAWLGVFPLGFIVGTFAGLKFVSFTESDLLGQVATMFKPLIVVKHVAAAAPAAAAAQASIDWAGTVGGTISALLMFVGVVSVLIYFFFSLEHKGVVGKSARVGIWFLMITFGASFGFTVMGRIALLAARFEFLVNDWLWLVDPGRNH